MQDQVLTEFKFEAGIVTEQTPLTPGNFWTDSDKIRFRFGKPELMGGWQNVTLPAHTAKLLGFPRLIDNLRSLSGGKAVVIGTNIGLFSSNLSTFYNITPATGSVSGTGILSATAQSRTVIVSISAHGLTDGTVVGIVSANTSIGGTIALTPNSSTTVAYQVSVINANSFSVRASVSAVMTSAATGGSITVINYYTAGPASDRILGGYGGGVWGGSFGYGTATGASIRIPMRHWSSDQWGTDMMLVPNDGPLIWWSPQSNIATVATIVTAAPSVNSIVRVATEARHVLLYGTHDIGGTYDPLLIRWSSSEDFTDWTPTQTNTAGDFRLNSSGSEIVGVVKMRDQMLIYTDAELFLQNYIGPNDVFGFTRASRNCGLLARNGAVEFSGVVYWISATKQFFKYDGRVQPLPCTVLRRVFDNMDPTKTSKIYAGTNSQFGEIIWFYTSLNSLDGENDSYVMYNTIENTWYIGTMRRTTWMDSSAYPQILATGTYGSTNEDGLFYQETGYAAGTSTMRAFLYSDYLDVNSGDDILFCNKYIPDVQSVDGTPFQENLNVSFLYRKYPGGPVLTKGPYLINDSVQKISTRIRGRELALSFESETSAASKAWHMGVMRLGIQADGKR